MQEYISLWCILKTHLASLVNLFKIVFSHPGTQFDDDKYTGKLKLTCLNILMLHIDIIIVRYSTELSDLTRDFDDGQIMFFLCKIFYIFYEDVLSMFQYLNEYLTQYLLLRSSQSSKFTVVIPVSPFEFYKADFFP